MVFLSLLPLLHKSQIVFDKMILIMGQANIKAIFLISATGRRVSIRKGQNSELDFVDRGSVVGHFMIRESLIKVGSPDIDTFLLELSLAI